MMKWHQQTNGGTTMTTLFKRINDLISANINDLLDRVEDPERMLKQVIREMEEAVNRTREAVVDAIASEKRLKMELDQQRTQAAEWLKRAEDALRQGNEALARAALTRKQEYENTARTLDTSWQVARTTSERLKSELKSLEAKLEEAQRKRGTLVARQRAAEARQQLSRTELDLRAGLNAHAEFARLEDRVMDMEARTAAWSEVRGESEHLDAEFRELRVQTEVESELEALRRKLQDAEKP
jgi:phage shock protein A